MERLFVSMMKLSTAMMMFGLERVGEGARSLRSDADREETVSRMRGSVDEVTEAMRGQMSEAKRDAVDSISRVTEEIADDLLDRESTDPADIIRSAGDLFKRSADAFADWLGDRDAGTGEPEKATASADRSSDEEPDSD